MTFHLRQMIYLYSFGTTQKKLRNNLQVNIFLLPLYNKTLKNTKMKTQQQIISHFCECAKLNEKEFLADNLQVGGWLYLRNTGITQLPDNLQVGGSLDLQGTGITQLPDNLQVGGSLDLQGTGITQLPDNLQVGGSLYLRGTGITQLPDNLQVGGSLYLQGTGITQLPDNLQVGGCLDLRNTGITQLPDNLQVGGWLDLQGTGITQLPDNLQVGWSLYLPNGEEKYIGADVQRVKPQAMLSKDGRWIIADGIRTEIISRKANVYRVRKVARKGIEYLITDGNGNYAHGTTLQEAKDDLIFKTTDRKTSDYESLTMDSKLSHAEAVLCYRVITGAGICGIKHFISTVLAENRKDEYTVSEICKLTEGQYGNEVFVKFFNK